LEVTMVEPGSRCQIYTRLGDSYVLRATTSARELAPERSPTIADRVGVVEIMTRDMVCARPDVPRDVLARLLIEHRIGCVPIVDERGRPRGIVTKLDLIEEHENDPMSGEAAAWVVAADLMMPMALTLDEHASVAHAAAMMVQEDLHHVMIVSESGVLVGVVSSQDIVRWVVANDELAGSVKVPKSAFASLYE
jgi:CBS domain-containing protein